MQRSFISRSVYSLSRILARLVGKVFFRLRWSGTEHWPKSGGALVCANHQSFFDPVLVGLTCDRQLNYLARKSLFRFALFRWLIQFYDAIPIDRDGMGVGGLKETLRRLRRDEIVLIFPEGTRSHDGQLQPLQPGFCAVARRARQPLVPVAIDGAYDAWPRHKKFPRLARIGIYIGESISAESIAAWDDEQLLANVSQAIGNCFEVARSMRS